MKRKHGRAGTAIGFCTYKRAKGLANLLEHIGRLNRLGELLSAVIVVDNDGSDPEVAATVNAFRERTGLRVEFIVERKPGISAARNAVFLRADELSLRFLAMLDDDEWPAPNWLEELLAKQAESGVSVVGGPVRPVFPADRQYLLPYARFWSVERQYLKGRPFVFGTGNFLIDLDAIADHPRPLFDEEFGLSGGGDTVFFRGLFLAGHQMDWTDAAVLHEEVPPSRASFAWVRQRYYRSGNHAVRWETISSGRLRPLLKTLGLAARLLIYPLLGREKEQPLFGWLVECDKIHGRFASHFGIAFIEYARKPS